jgi:hypothetical protein
VSHSWVAFLSIKQYDVLIIIRPLSVEERRNRRQEQTWTDDTLVLLNVGAMTGNKGLRILLRALQRACVEMTAPPSWVRRIVLILKGQDELYTSEEFLRSAIADAGFDPQQCPSLSLAYVGGVFSAEDVALLMQVRASACPLWLD